MEELIEVTHRRRNALIGPVGERVEESTSGTFMGTMAGGSVGALVGTGGAMVGSIVTMGFSAGEIVFLALSTLVGVTLGVLDSWGAARAVRRYAAMPELAARDHGSLKAADEAIIALGETVENAAALGVDGARAGLESHRRLVRARNSLIGVLADLHREYHRDNDDVERAGVLVRNELTRITDDAREATKVLVRAQAMGSDLGGRAREALELSASERSLARESTRESNDVLDAVSRELNAPTALTQ